MNKRQKQKLKKQQMEMPKNNENENQDSHASVYRLQGNEKQKGNDTSSQDIRE